MRRTVCPPGLTAVWIDFLLGAESSFAPVDADLARAPELVGDVGRRHGAEERPLRSGVDLEAEHRLSQRLGDVLGLLEAPRLVAGPLGVSLLHLCDERRRGGLGEAAGLEVVAHEAARYRDDLAAEADLVH